MIIAPFQGWYVENRFGECVSGPFDTAFDAQCELEINFDETHIVMWWS